MVRHSREGAIFQLGSASSLSRCRPEIEPSSGRISKRGNGYLRTFFMQAARVILLRSANWPKHGFGLWAKAATSTIPIVFSVGSDPVKLGLVDSLNRPAGNITGVNYFTQDLGPKRLGLLRELMPAGADVVVLVNPKSPITDSALKDLQSEY